MTIPEFREVEITKAVDVDIDAESIVDAIANLADAVIKLTDQVEKSIEALRITIHGWTP